MWNSSVDVDFVLILFEPFRLVRNFSFHVFVVVGILRRKNISGVGCFVFWTSFFHAFFHSRLGRVFSLPGGGIFRPLAMLRGKWELVTIVSFVIGDFTWELVTIFSLANERPLWKRKF